MPESTVGFRVSVIIPAYNAESYLTAAVESVLAQTMPAFEVIVVDDGSSDRTREVAEKYGERIRYFRRENQGVSKTRNFAIDQAQGDWLAFLDADDEWHADKLLKCSEYCRHESQPVCVFTDFELFGDRTGICRPSEELKLWDAEQWLLVPTVSVMPSAAMVRAGLPVRFPEWAANDEDAIYFNDLSQQGAVLAVPEVLTRYRRHDRSAQAQSGSARRGFANLLRWAESKNDQGLSRQKLLQTFVNLVERARWKRDWNQYWNYRDLAGSHWPAGEPLPKILTERIYPRVVYRIKDWIDGLRRPARRP